MLFKVLVLMVLWSWLNVLVVVIWILGSGLINVWWIVGMSEFIYCIIYSDKN